MNTEIVNGQFLITSHVAHFLHLPFTLYFTNIAMYFLFCIFTWQ